VLEYLHAVMAEELGLIKVNIPVDPTSDAKDADGSPSSAIFVSPDLLKNSAGLFIIIQGSGAVRPGQWARALCINDSLREGSCLLDI